MKMYREATLKSIYKLQRWAFSLMNTWKLTTGGLLGACQCGNTEKKRRDWVKKETPLHKHEPPFSVAKPWWQEQGPARLQHSRVPRPPAAPSPCRALASHDPAPPGHRPCSSRTASCCHRLQGLGRGGSRQPYVPLQMGPGTANRLSRAWQSIVSQGPAVDFSSVFWQFFKFFVCLLFI